MTGEERRKELLNRIENSSTPVSGTALSKQLQVSRQVIVQDIALLRAAQYEIQSTPRGYLLVQNTAIPEETQTTVEKSMPKSEEGISRTFRVSHTDEQIEDELNTIVDMGGRVVDVAVEHEVYGFIRADLPIHCRRHVQEFMEGIRSGKSRPLKNLTLGIHYHTVTADSEETLDLVELELQKKGYLV